ncbi:DUF2796 domain-containing protein [Alteromonas sp. 1_MG-2023]|uniref:ZrgA family zinc uptake protein n=1 Tax=Alteromonas sp. 1_MG-2023 TaxID=3062669 RepID=UPI0026E29F3D|nr:DUF2796 domain-containing protein [Alteromonas sp. 1_MG-2023]MDO6566979.1 DUF2796 domain-containing protein [Alteromonas sp. 1_MG-2023]
MNKPYLAVSSLLFFSLGLTVNAQQHVHGQGELLIVQEGSELNVQLVLPAADALGFEHEPETSEQHKIHDQLAERFETNTDVIDVEGQCELVGVEHTLEAHDEHASDYGRHEEHDKDHEDDDHDSELASHEKHGDHDEHEEENHQNIEVEYQFHCDEAVSRISVSLFESMPSLSSIQAQWVTENGQGLTELSASRPSVSW